MHSSFCMKMSAPSQTLLSPSNPPASFLPARPSSSSLVMMKRRRACLATTWRAHLSSTREAVLKHFHQGNALKIISGLQNLDRDNIAAVVTVADKGGATHVDIACEPELVKLAISLTSLPVKLAEQLELEGVDIIHTEGGRCSSPSKSGVLGLIEKATPTLAAAYLISRAVNIPVTCSSGLSAVTAPMAITAGASGAGVGSAVNKLNDVVAMIAEVRSLAESLGIAAAATNPNDKKFLKLGLAVVAQSWSAWLR